VIFPPPILLPPVHLLFYFPVTNFPVSPSLLNHLTTATYIASVLLWSDVGFPTPPAILFPKIKIMTTKTRTRTGKIARLPHAIREQLNLRIQDNERGKSLLQWLNDLPEVQTVLNEHFAGKPISHQNLTEWKQGGFIDWQMRQDALQLANNLNDENSLGDKAFADFSEKLARWLILRFAATAQNLTASEPDPKAQWARLRELCADVARLRRGDLYARHLGVQRDSLALRETNSAFLKEKQFHEWAQRPEIRRELLKPKEEDKHGGGMTDEEIAEFERMLNLL